MCMYCRFLMGTLQFVTVSWHVLARCDAVELTRCHHGLPDSFAQVKIRVVYIARKKI